MGELENGVKIVTTVQTSDIAVQFCAALCSSVTSVAIVDISVENE